MIRPAAFAGNPQTAGTNRFQQATPSDAGQAATLARLEFDRLAAALREAGVRVIEFADTPDAIRPDAVFPNNWVSFHADGSVVLYPMLAVNRRLERRGDIIRSLAAEHGFAVHRVVDLTAAEDSGRYLEGTGSLVLDRVHRKAYACLSPRTDERLLRDFCLQLGYEAVPFHAADAAGVPVYHTNVILSVGTTWAVVCAAMIAPADRQAVLDSLASTGHEVITLEPAQVTSFAGNVLELESRAGARIVAMSAAARASLDPRQVAALHRHGLTLLSSPLPTIEALGGGSARCMLAEVHLPQGIGD